MKKFDELFKVVSWNELVNEKTYYVLCTDAKWSELDKYSGNYIYNEEEDKLVRYNGEYFKNNDVDGLEITILDYLGEVEQ